MKAFFRRFGTITCTCALLFSPLLSGCAKNSTVGRDTFVIIEAGDATTMNPLFTQDAGSNEFQSLIFDSLITLVPGYRVAPDLAVSWHDTPDHRHWIVQLRRGVRWSDGAPFTSSDVVWTWNAMLDPATADPYIGQFNYVKGIHAQGPYTVRFDVTPSALFVLNVLGTMILPEHILDKYSHRAQIGTDFSEHPIGTGPYVLTQWQHQSSLQFSRNPLYWRGKPKIPHLLFRIVFNNEAGIQAITNGDAQLLDGILSTAAEELRGVPNVEVIKSPSLYTDLVIPNERRPGLNENAVLQAMMYGWDRAALIKGLYHGNDIIATGIEPPALVDWYDPHVHLYPYDRRKARALLDRAGWKPGRDGIREKHGKRLAYTLLSSDRTGDGTDRLSEFQADMHAIGIAISLQLLDFTTFTDKENSGQFDLLDQGWGGGTDPDQYTFLDSSQVSPLGNNYMHYSDPEVDRDLRLGMVTLDQAKRKALYDDMQRRTAEHLPALYVLYGYARIAISSRVLINRNAIFPGNLFYNIGDWRLAP